MNLEELLESLDIGEGADIEFKSAKGDYPEIRGRPSRPSRPRMGGVLVLGVVERRGCFAVEGVDRVRGQLKTFIGIAHVSRVIVFVN